MKEKIKKEKLKIAMIGHKAVPSRRGGIELVLTTMCPIMVEKGHDVTCYNRSGGEAENEYAGTVKNNMYKGVKLKKVFTVNKKGLAAMTSSFSAAICASFKKYDVVHFHAEGPCAALWIPKLFGKKCVCTIHGIDWKREKWKGGFGSKYIKFGEKVAAKFADEVIVLSKSVQQYFMDTYRRETVLIPNGVSRPQIREAQLITEKFGLHKDEYICALSRLTEEKGIHYLIEAYQQVKTDKKLVIAGDTSDTDDYVKKLKHMAAGNPNIIFTGFVSGNLFEELFSNAYVYVLPSNLEGMPLSLLEAMSFGNAVIGSSIPEITDVVENKAIIFKKADVANLRDKLQEVCDDKNMVLKYKTGVADFICSKYNWNAVVDRTLELYYGK
ncbi:glycosyltransferase family 4 protein [Acetivibrio mesophilus]|uniref:Glycosyltransferase n=1 Tax=Acetivibrio mesophilus TaxID=2487273 RepID=A0A4Q0I346_9FIRM|nr:glycosyltransferase family 4 protein [Acetivibrio mesophilus]RXE58674.1 glycosyltransferase [Acetivibrio mesophilus]